VARPNKAERSSGEHPGADVSDQGGDAKELDRIIFFSDAIFAIVMTLLILDIPVPDLPPGLVEAELPGRVLDLWPKFFSYVLSFIVVGSYWIAHHGTFRYFRSYDKTLIWLNLLFLLSISFVPFPTALLGEYGEQQFAVVLYAISLAIPRRLLASLWWYAIRGRVLVSDSMDPGMSRYHLIRSLAIPSVFLLSIVVSFFSVTAAVCSWFLMFVADTVVWRLQERYRWL
jgi:uncharacterized membrane protein